MRSQTLSALIYDHLGGPQMIQRVHKEIDSLVDVEYLMPGDTEPRRISSDLLLQHHGTRTNLLPIEFIERRYIQLPLHDPSFFILHHATSLNWF